jgi:hypothetical protein
MGIASDLEWEASWRSRTASARSKAGVTTDFSEKID